MIWLIASQEKHGKDKNAAFEHDFKTLADVLIQVWLYLAVRSISTLEITNCLTRKLCGTT